MERDRSAGGRRPVISETMADAHGGFSRTAERASGERSGCVTARIFRGTSHRSEVDAESDRLLVGPAKRSEANYDGRSGWRRAP